MPTAEQIQDAIATVHNQESFIKNLLIDALGWKIPEGTPSVEEISYPWTATELNAEGLDKKIVDGQIWQIQPLEENRSQPWGIFVLEFTSKEVFTTGRGLTGTLRKILRGLVPKVRQQSNRKVWERDNLLFICTHNYEHYRFAYFKAPKESQLAPLTTFGWGPDIPYRTACEFNLPALEWPDDPADTESWVKKWQAAFDKEALTKQFFTIFAVLYEKVVEDVAEVPDLKENAGKLAQLLLDRMLFLYFIQRKGWLDQKQGYLYSHFLDCYKKNPKGHSYYSSFLYPLFLALSDANTAIDGLGTVPFLNGGLFEENAKLSQAEQIQRAHLRIKNSTFKDIFEDLLERFNFTVTEDTPIDVEVAIDPEMLGKIFESLVLQLEKYPDKDLRKLTGSYYTPRPIVHYMCQQAIKEYLVTQLAGENIVKAESARESVSKLLDLPTADQLNAEQVQSLAGLFTEAESKMLRQEILNCRVCDPAVGSGAFPVGMLHEMLAAIARFDLRIHGRNVLEQRNYYYDLKKQIIESCLYGVDIQEQAVRLCELRLWLSLVVDYQINITKPFEKAIREVPSLPNLSYRIIRGDSLLERLFGHLVQLDTMAKDAKTKQLIESIQADKQAYFREANTDEKHRFELKILAKQADLAERLIEAKQLASGVQGDFWGKEAITAKDRKERAEQEARAREFADLKANVAKAKAELERLGRLKGTVDRGDIDTLRRQYFQTGEYPTFMWRMDFAEVFGEKGGFDIVIANPPYISYYSRQAHEIDKATRDYYLYHYAFLRNTKKKSINSVMLFLERAIDILSENKYFVYIIDIGFYEKVYKEIRKFISEFNIFEIVTDISAFESVASGQLIIFVKKERTPNFKCSVKRDFKKTDKFLSRDEFQKDTINMSFADKKLENLRDVIPLGNICDITCGLEYGALRNLFLSNEKKNEKYHKVVNGGYNIPEKYCLKWDKNKDGYVLFDKDCEEKLTRKRLNISESGKIVHFISGDEKKYLEKKLFIRQSALEIIAAYDDQQYYALRSIFLCNPKDVSYDLKYILAILNSRFITVYSHLNGIIRYVKGKQPQIRVDGLKKIPIKKTASQNNFIEIVDKILSLTQTEDYLQSTTKQGKVKELEKRIDQMVYKLYGLTDEEKDIVENSGS